MVIFYRDSMIRKYILILASVFYSIEICAENITFKTNAPEAVVKGKQFRVSYVVNTQNVKEFRVPSLTDFEVLMGPTSSIQSSRTVINGKTESSTTVTYTFILMATKEGNFDIPGASIIADGQQIKSNSSKIRVLPADVNADFNNSQGSYKQDSQTSSTTNGTTVSNQDLFITATINKTNVYEQEALLLTYKVYFAVNLRELEIKMPELKGFHSQEVELKRGQPTLEHYNGRNYQSLVWSQYVLYPQQTGKLEIPSIDFDATIGVRRNIDPFDAFFNGISNYVDVRKTISTPKLLVNVLPLPSGKPMNFSGAVGDFSMNTSISTTSLKVNEAVTLKLEIKGTGNLKLIDIPEVNFPQGFETYDPKVINQFNLTKHGQSGKKVFEYLAIPRYAGEYVIPNIEFSYFDLESKSYKTLSSDSFKLKVEKGEVVDNQLVTDFTTKENIKLLGKDIRYIKIGNIDSFLSENNLFFGSMLYYLCYLVPSLFFIIVVCVYRKRVSDNRNISKTRKKNANKVAVKRLKVANKLLKENRKEDFYDEILKALWGYIGDKLNIPISRLNKDTIENDLQKYQMDESLTSEFLRILNTCEFAKYSPMGGEGSMKNVYDSAIIVISKMESLIKRVRK